ncbi:MAG TPA: Na+/H+ antiporter NhaA [Gemmatimonadaceae bacterium]|nr:Na+/H+ antiporter NhaA [Gemmatimonadaceae bacterium]
MSHPTSPSPATGPLIPRMFGPLERFAQSEASGGIVLLACTAVALLWANSPWAASYVHLWEWPVTVGGPGFGITASLHHWINDGLMAVFFLVVGLEIKRETLVGELASLRRAALPAAAALGGMLVPALLYTLVAGGGPAADGWGIPMATDIAFALGVLALLGPRVPLALKVFLTALAIVDDLGAVVVIAVFYSGGLAWNALALAGVVLVLLAGLNATGIRHPAPYALLGLVLWAALFHSGVHATIAGVLLAMTIPARNKIDAEQFLRRARRTLDDFATAGSGATPLVDETQQNAIHELEVAAEQVQAPLLKLEHKLHGVVAFVIMPLFALSNAGVTLPDDLAAALTAPVTLGILLGLVLGKPIGITLFAWLAVRLGLADRMAGVSWRDMLGVAWLGGIGFTMSLFITGLAFTSAARIDDAKLGILTASTLAGIGGWLLLRSGAGREAETAADAGAPPPTAAAVAAGTAAGTPGTHPQEAA